LEEEERREKQLNLEPQCSGVNGAGTSLTPFQIKQALKIN
jgi:hypothetical protein